MRFTKAHGLGNDFLLVARDQAPEAIAAWARRLCDRHLGVGADGVMLYQLENDGVRMRLLNADGSDGDISGNGLRCLAAHVVRAGFLPGRHVIQTPPGPRAVEVERLSDARYRVLTDLGEPVLRSDLIPVALEPMAERVMGHVLEAAGQLVEICATSLGNPHCAVFVDQLADDALLWRLGPALERHAFFPRRTNVEFVTVVSRGELRVRFWERGVGYTQASGTGAASAAVAAMLTGRTDRSVRVVCDGGTLDVQWPEGGAVRQTGEAEILFEGDWLG